MMRFGVLRGDSRSKKAAKNIIVASFFKVGDTLIYLLLVPLTLDYLNPFEYGIWITLNSILGWINSFDIGLGNGLRNKLSEAIASDDKEAARKYVSTAFVLLFCLGCILAVLGIFLIHKIDWYQLLNVSTENVNNLVDIITFSYIFFCINFVLKTIGNIYQALQLPSALHIMNFLGHLLALVAICILKQTVDGSLLWIAIVYSAAPPFVYLCAYPVTFYYLFKYLRPSFGYFDKNSVSGLFNLSIVFFLLQISSVILFSLSNLIISNIFGPTEVTAYNITQRYFSVVSMLFGIVLTPMWSAATDAYVKGELLWIQNTMRKLRRILLLVGVLLVVMVVFSPVIFDLWIGNDVNISVTLVGLMALYNYIIMYSLCYSYFLNGIGKLKLQSINTILVAMCFYPLCHYLALNFHVYGVIVSMCILNLPGAIINTIQFNKVINKTAKGIWNK